MTEWNLTPEQQAALGPEPTPDGKVNIEYLDGISETVYFDELRRWNDGVQEDGSYGPYIHLLYHTNRRVQIPRQHIRRLDITMNSASVAEAIRTWRLQCQKLHNDNDDPFKEVD